jgi:hypothetical protein
MTRLFIAGKHYELQTERAGNVEGFLMPGAGDYIRPISPN